MKKDIILAGVGGQGILTIAAIIGHAALESGLFVKQSEVHGMSQRGGDVQSHMRISDKEIASDLIPGGKADMIISVEPMEALRYLPMISPDAWVITNNTPFINIPNYPDIADVIDTLEKLKNCIVIDADNLAKELQSPKSANIIILGAAASHLGIPLNIIEQSIRIIFGKKGEEIVNANIAALRKGSELSINN